MTVEDAFRVAHELRSIADQIAAGLPVGRARLGDQLRAAITAIEVHIVGGADTALREPARLFRVARHSTTEAAAILDACRIVSRGAEPAHETARRLLLVIFAGLTELISGTTTGSSASASTLASQLYIATV